MRKQPSLDGNPILAGTAADLEGRLAAKLPPEVEIYARTPDFTHLTIPAELTASHALGEGVWGLLRVLEGTLRLSLGSVPMPLTIGAGQSAVIEPERTHRVAAPGPVRFFIEFHIAKDTIRPTIPSGTC